MTTTVANLQAVFTADTTNFDRGLSNVDNAIGRVSGSIGTQLGNIGTNLQNAGRQISGIGKSMMLAAAPVAAAFGGAIAKSIEFESAFAGVRKTVDGTDEELAALRDTIRDMATDASNPLSSLDNAHVTLSQIMELGGQLGVPRDELEKFTEVVGKLAMSTNLTAEEAATMFAQFQNVTGMDPGLLDNMGAVLVDLGNNSATTEKAIMEMGNRIAAAGSAAGINEEEILGFAAALSSMGVKAELGGTNFSKFLGALASGVAQGGSELDMFANISGMSADAFAQQWETDATGAVLAFIDGLSGMSQAEQLLALDELGLTGTEMTRVLTSLAGNTDLVKQSLETANIALGQNTALNEEAAARAATTESKMNLMKNTINDAAISVGDALTPALNDLLSAVTPVIADFSQWAQDNPQTVTTIAAVTGGVIALGAGLTVLGGIVSLAGTAISALGSLIGGAGVIIGVAKGAVMLLGGALAALLSPIGLAIAGGVALGVAFVANFGGIKDFVVNQVIPRIQEFVSSLGGLAEAIAPHLQAVLGVFMDIMGGIIGAVGNVIGAIGGIKKAISGALSEMGKLLSAGDGVDTNGIEINPEGVANIGGTGLGAWAPDGAGNAPTPGQADRKTVVMGQSNRSAMGRSSGGFGGGAGGSQVVIQQVVVQANNLEHLYDQLMRVAQDRAS